MGNVYKTRSIKEILWRQWFLLSVLLCILFAEIFPNLGATGGILHPEYTVKYLAVGVIFFISGISMTLDEILTATTTYKLHAFIQCFTFIFIPLMVLTLTSFIKLLLDINPWILKGLVTVSCMPPPVSSAIIITKAIGGNEAAAVFNSILGSFIGIIVTPISLLLFLGSTAIVSMLNSMVLLAQTVLFPLLIGLFLRHFKIIKSIKAMPLTTIGQLLLLFIIYTTFCDAFIAHDTPMMASDILVTVILVVFIQLAFLYASFHLSLNLHWFNPADVVAITFCSTHKSLTLGIPILRILFSGYSHFSQISLPLLIYHPVQIILGGLLLPPFKKWLIYNKHRMKILP